MRLRLTELLFAVSISLWAAIPLLGSQQISIAQSIGHIKLENPWVKATPTNARVAGGYVIINNHGANPDRLIGAEYSGAKKTEIHQMSMDNGIMKMRPLNDGLEIPAGGYVTLKPGGYHIMLMGLKSGMVEGETAKLKLTFEHAGTMEVDFPVMKKAGMDHSSHGMKHSSDDGHSMKKMMKKESN